MTKPLPELQIASLYRIHPNKIEKLGKTPPDVFSNIVDLSNKALAENDRFKEVKIDDDKWNQLQDIDFKIQWWISVRHQEVSGASKTLQFFAENQEAQFQEKKIELGTVTEHHLIFLYRVMKRKKAASTAKKIENMWDIFALTTNKGGKSVIRYYTDFSFPLQIARRICEPALLNAKKIPLVGDYMSIDGQYKKPHLITYSAIETLSQIVKGFDAVVKTTSTLYEGAPFNQFVTLEPKEENYQKN